MSSPDPGSVQQNVRVANIMIHRDVRMAGFGVASITPSPAFEVGYIDTDGDGSPDTYTNNDSNHGNTDAIFVRYLESPGQTIADYNGAAANLRVCTPSGFNEGDVLFIETENRQEFRKIQVTQIQEVTDHSCDGGKADKVNFSPGLSIFNSPGGLGADYTGAIAWRLIERCYYINPDADSDGVQDDPQLMTIDNYGTPMPFAEDKEDLQVVYIMNDGVETTNPSRIDDIRYLKITILGRTTIEFRGFFSTRPAIEDHSAATSSDGYRRQQQSAKTRVRNMGLL